MAKGLFDYALDYRQKWKPETEDDEEQRRLRRERFLNPERSGIPRALAAGAVAGTAGLPMDTIVGAGNLVRAGTGYLGSKFGMGDLPELVDPANIPGTSEDIIKRFGVGDSPSELAATMIAQIATPLGGGRAAQKGIQVATKAADRTLANITSGSRVMPGSPAAQAGKIGGEGRLKVDNPVPGKYDLSITDKGKPVGTASISQPTREQHPVLWSIGVSPEHQGKGYASRMLDEAVRIGRTEYPGSHLEVGAVGPKIAEMAARRGGTQPYAEAPDVWNIPLPRIPEGQEKHIGGWGWRDLDAVKKDLGGLNRVEPYITDTYGQLMKEQAARAAKGDLNARDLIKAYGITQSSIGRKSRNINSELAQGSTRPEGLFSEWLMSPAGRDYLDAAIAGKVDNRAIADLQKHFRPYGKDNVMGEAMRYAATDVGPRAAGLNKAITGSLPELRGFMQDIKGIAGPKSGFISSLLGDGRLPTADARQLILNSGGTTDEATRFLRLGGGKGGDEAVNRIAGRQEQMGLSLPPDLEPFRQHLTHHAVWDKVAGERTTHEDLVRAMRLAGIGGVAAGASLYGANDAEAGPIDAAIKGAGKVARRTAAESEALGYKNPLGTRNLDILEKDMRHTVEPTVPLAARKDTKWEDLANKGYVVVAPPGDRTRIGKVTSVGGLKTDVDSQGGPLYGPANDHRGYGWASTGTPAVGLFNTTARIQREGGTPLIMPTSMGLTAGDFSHMHSDLMLSQIKARGGLPKGDAKIFDGIIKGKYPKVGWLGINHPEVGQQLRDMPGAQRLKIMQEMDKASVAHMFPDVPQTRRALIEDEFLRDDPYTTGRVILKANPEKGLLRDAPPEFKHHSYELQIPANVLGGVKEPIPLEWLLQGWADERAAARAADPTLTRSADIRSHSMSHPTQPLDQKWLDRLMRQREARDRKLREGGP